MDDRASHITKIRYLVNSSFDFLALSDRTKIEYIIKAFTKKQCQMQPV